MEPKLSKALNTQSGLTYLRDKMMLGLTEVPCRSLNNTLRMMIEYDSRIGYLQAGKIVVNVGGWSRVRDIVKTHVGIDILTFDPSALSESDRVDNAGVVANEKLGSRAPMQGFAECRIIGPTEHISASTRLQYQRETGIQEYLGLHIDILALWQLDNIIVVENFNAFCRIDSGFINSIRGLRPGVSLLVYRGHNNKGITEVLDFLACRDSRRYVFADYDLAGLQILESVDRHFNADGFILPEKPWETTSTLKRMSVSSVRGRQSHIGTTLKCLQPYRRHIKDEYLAVPQEAFIARKTPLIVESANPR